jgi:CubicO group peptidase (beta-lactamase class C family)
MGRMLKLINGISALGIVALAAVSAWPGGASQRTTQIGELLAPIRAQHNLPALAGAVLTSRGLVDIGAVGVRKAGAEIPVTDADEWHLGSDTKAMTATVIASLVEKGKLSWDVTMERMFPEVAKSMNTAMRSVTLLELLSHRAGLPHDVNWREASRSGTLREQREAVVRMVAAMQPLSPPGSKYEYSNLGYVLAGIMAERVTNTAWEELITRTIFEPLGMKSAGFGGTGTPGKIDQPWPHFATGKPTERNGPMVDNPEVMGPAGTVHCSLADWAKFVADQLRGERGERALLKPESYRALHSPPFGGNYACGWLVVERPWGGGTVLTHAGSNTMNYAVVWMAPKRDFAALVCTNQGGDAAAKACDEAAGVLIKRQGSGM